MIGWNARVGIAVLLAAIGIILLLWGPIGTDSVDEPHEQEEVSLPGSHNSDHSLPDGVNRERVDDAWSLDVFLADGGASTEVDIFLASGTDGQRKRLVIPGTLGLLGEGPWLALATGPEITPQLFTISAEDRLPEALPKRLLRSGTFIGSLRNPSELGSTGPVMACLSLELSEARSRFEASSGVPLLPPPAGILGPRLVGIQRIAHELGGLDDESVVLTELSKLGRDASLVQRIKDGVTPTGGMRLTIEVPPDGVCEFSGIPASSSGYQWKLISPVGYEITPDASKRFVSPGVKGFVANRGSPDGGHWSAPFSVDPGGVTRHSAELFPHNSISGQLDFGVVQDASLSGAVYVFAENVVENEYEQSMVEYRLETVGLADESGRFKVEGLRPGRKRVSALWRTDDSGIERDVVDQFIAVRFCDLLSDSSVDLGLISPLPSSVTSVVVSLAWDDGVPVDWNTLYGPGTAPGAFRLTLSNREANPPEVEDFWGVMGVRVGQVLRIHGMAPGEWLCYGNPDSQGGSSPWPDPVLPVRLVNYQPKERFENERDVDVTLEITFKRLAAISVEFPAGFSGPGALNLRSRVSYISKGDDREVARPFGSLERDVDGRYFGQISGWPLNAVVLFDYDDDGEKRGGRHFGWVQTPATPVLQMTVRLAPAVEPWILVSRETLQALDEAGSSDRMHFDILDLPVTEDPHFSIFVEEGEVQLHLSLPPGALLRERTLAQTYLVGEDGKVSAY